MIVLPLLLAMAGFPSAEIGNGALTVRLYLPDAQAGYYRGTRFDWSGQIGSLKTAGHEYFGQWFERYDPKLHDSIQGPVEEFSEVAGEGVYLRVGVGLVKRPDDKPYDRFRTYEIVDPGVWKVARGKDWIRMTHTLKAAGFGYRYVKTIRLVGKEMVIDHELRNTGSRALELTQYNHQFFVMDGKATGPETEVDFPFDLRAKQGFREGAGLVEGGRRIRYSRELAKGESVFGIFEGAPVAGFDIRVGRNDTGAGVRIRGDRAIESLVFWSIRTTVCPEPYVRVDTGVGGRTRWRYSYLFE